MSFNYPEQQPDGERLDADGRDVRARDVDGQRRRAGQRRRLHAAGGAARRGAGGGGGRRAGGRAAAAGGGLRAPLRQETAAGRRLRARLRALVRV